MNENRKDTVERIFIILDQDNDGLIDVRELKACYNAKRHPDVMQGKRSADAILVDFNETFD